MRGTGPRGHTPSERGMFTSDSWMGGWLEAGWEVVLVIKISAGAEKGKESLSGDLTHALRIQFKRDWTLKAVFLNAAPPASHDKSFDSSGVLILATIS